MLGRTLDLVARITLKTQKIVARFTQVPRRLLPILKALDALAARLHLPQCAVVKLVALGRFVLLSLPATFANVVVARFTAVELQFFAKSFATVITRQVFRRVQDSPCRVLDDVALRTLKNSLFYLGSSRAPTALCHGLTLMQNRLIEKLLNVVAVGQ